MLCGGLLTRTLFLALLPPFPYPSASNGGPLAYSHSFCPLLSTATQQRTALLVGPLFCSLSPFHNSSRSTYTHSHTHPLLHTVFYFLPLTHTVVLTQPSYSCFYTHPHAQSPSLSLRTTVFTSFYIFKLHLIYKQYLRASNVVDYTQTNIPKTICAVLYYIDVRITVSLF